MKKLPRYLYAPLAVFATATVILVIFMPRPDQLKINYELNRPWDNAQLLAPFDFPVYRDSLEKKSMTDSVRRNFIPVFTVDDTPLRQIKSTINASDLFSESERRAAVTAIERLYKTGIAENDIAARIARGNLTEILINDKNGKTTAQPSAGIRSTRRAYEFFDSLLSAQRPAMMQKLRSVGFASMLRPNYVEDREASQRLLNDRLAPIEAGIGVIQRGEKIVDRGEIVNTDIYRILRSYERASLEERGRVTGNSGFNIALGQFLYVVTLMLALGFFLWIFRRQVFLSLRRTLCLVSLTTAFTVFAVVMNNTFSGGLYIVPFAILPILVSVFYDTATAMFTHVITILLCATFAVFPLEFIFIEVNAGIVAVFSMRELSRRSQLLRTALLIFTAYVVSYAAVELMQVASLNTFSWRLIGAFAVNMVLISFAYILIFIVEKLFGFTSVVTLVELADINNPVLQELSEECPGTFQHSMAVSNLAADAARRIGANVQLVRAGALYHDIGKTRNPAFFTENQHGVNPHSTLDPRQSAQIIIRHVTDGLKMAEKHKLPRVIRDMIAQHHGKSTARYFLTTWQNAHPGEDTDPAPFTYPGPNPQSLEASLLMMADVVEAASRSLKEHTPEAISALVNKLIDTQVAEGLHKDSPLSFRDISIIKQAFIDRLRTMYHVRIAYPERK